MGQDQEQGKKGREWEWEEQRTYILCSLFWSRERKKREVSGVLRNCIRVDWQGLNVPAVDGSNPVERVSDFGLPMFERVGGFDATDLDSDFAEVAYGSGEGRHSGSWGGRCARNAMDATWMRANAWAVMMVRTLELMDWLRPGSLDSANHRAISLTNWRAPTTQSSGC